MLSEPLEARHLITAGSFLAGGILLGWALYRLILRRVKRGKTITSWGGDDIIVAAIHRVAIVWFAIGGAWAAALALPLEPDIESLIARGLLAAVILSGTIVAARMAADLVRLYALRTGGAIGSSSIFVNLARLVIFLVGALILLQTLGVSITPLLTALGVGGLAVALALQDTLANLFAGIQILASKKVKPGDFVRLDSGEEGYVSDINWRNVTIRQIPNNHIIVPNSKMASAIVTNFHRPQREMSVLVEVGVSYDSDLEHVERVTKEVARETMRTAPGGIPDFDPLVRFHTFDDFSINFTAILRVREYAEHFPLVSEFVKQLHRRYRSEGIEIPFPIRTVIRKDAAGADARSGAVPEAGAASAP